MLIRLATIFVDDQDRAKAFYTEKLGFALEADNVYGPGARWLTVIAPEEPHGARLLLNLATGASAEYQRATYNAGRPAIAFISRDCRAECERLRERGVVLRMEPTEIQVAATNGIGATTAERFSEALDRFRST